MAREPLETFTVPELVEELAGSTAIETEAGQLRYAASAEAAIAEITSSPVEQSNGLAYLADYLFAQEQYEMAEVLYWAAEGIHVQKVDYFASRLANYRFGRAKSLIKIKALDPEEGSKRISNRPGRFG